MDLTGCVAIVTGANTGIGKETARGLAERGARVTPAVWGASCVLTLCSLQVILACRSQERGQEAAWDIGGDTRQVTVKRCDLASFASVREFCRQVSCDWWRACHVTSVPASDWRRAGHVTLTLGRWPRRRRWWTSW